MRLLFVFGLLAFDNVIKRMYTEAVAYKYNS